MKVTIQGDLTDLNKYIDVQRKNRYAGNALKKKNTEICKAHFLKSGIGKINGAIDLKITWFCKNKRKDKDNIAFAIKFILDGLVEAGVIENDGWKQVNDFDHHFEVDSEQPRIEIELEEV